ncbi:drug/metabolite transporter (DMT)-like permease [Rhodoligotrophos appendicifer]|uniref:DMT family transporter n=1 Tax=Rhodoligotrophos appendicifer TaxID=987056 RepID=UPI001184D23E|nr:DMT family transporter [Rhodoligotrophos appendicifer]
MTLPSVHRSMGLREWFLLIALSVLWGGSFFFAGVAVKDLPVLVIVAGRVCIGALGLHILLLLLRQRMPTNLTAWRSFFAMGMMNNVAPFCLLVWGQTHIASGLASVLTATTPLFGVVIAHRFTRDEKLSANRALGAVIGFMGVAVMIGGGLSLAVDGKILGELACLAAAVCYACAGVYGRRFLVLGVRPLQAATGQVTASSLVLLPLALIVDRPWQLAAPSAASMAAVLGLGLLCTALAYVIFFRILSTAGATNIMLVTLLVPVTAILLGILILGEPIEPRQLGGMALIAFGLAVIDGRLWRGLRRRVGH